jgi:hypothetical protein
MSADGKPTRGRTRSLTDSARKRNRREVLVNYNKARLNKGHQHGRWMQSVNEFIWKEFYLGKKIELSYPKVDDLVGIIKEKGPDCLIFKKDL